MSQNLVSATLSAEDLTAIKENLASINQKLNFLLTLQPQERLALVKVGDNYSPFLDKAYQAAQNHPEILPGVFNKDEFFKDYELTKSLQSIHYQIKELADGVENTFFAASSDAMVGALEVYSAVKQNRDKVVGLNVAADELAAFFKKSPKKTTVK